MNDHSFLDIPVNTHQTAPLWFLVGFFTALAVFSMFMVSLGHAADAKLHADATFRKAIVYEPEVMLVSHTEVILTTSTTMIVL
jgi:hypothetical protein